MEFVSTIASVVTALTAVIGVCIAAYVGLSAVRLGKRTVERSAMDYAADRADHANDLAGDLVDLMHRLSATIATRATPAESSTDRPGRAGDDSVQLEDDLYGATFEIHSRMASKARRLADYLPTVQITLLDHAEEQLVPDLSKEDWAEIRDAVTLYERTYYVLYFSVEATEFLPDLHSHPTGYRDHMVSLLFGAHPENRWRGAAAEWIQAHLAKITDPDADSAAVMLWFEEDFARNLLMTQVSRVTQLLLDACRPRLVR
jgi:hypothetical protein